MRFLKSQHGPHLLPPWVAPPEWKCLTSVCVFLLFLPASAHPHFFSSPLLPHLGSLYKGIWNDHLWSAKLDAVRQQINIVQLSSEMLIDKALVRLHGTLFQNFQSARSEFHTILTLIDEFSAQVMQQVTFVTVVTAV